MHISIDYRERDLLEEMSQLSFPWFHNQISSIECKIVPLQLGDIDISNERTIVRIERKTWNDLHQSLRDGRYREQRSRLSEWRNQSNDKHHEVIYVIEGHPQHSFAKSMETIIHRLSFLYRFMIYRTYDLKETCHYIDWILSQFSHFSDTSLSSTSCQETRRHVFLEQTVSRKRDIISPTTLLAVSFYGVPGISKETAFILANKYKSIVHLLDQDPSLLQTELATINLGVKPLGEKKAKTIMEFFGFSF